MISAAPSSYLELSLNRLCLTLPLSGKRPVESIKAQRNFQGSGRSVGSASWLQAFSSAHLLNLCFPLFEVEAQQSEVPPVYTSAVAAFVVAAFAVSFPFGLAVDAVLAVECVSLV